MFSRALFVVVLLLALAVPALADTCEGGIDIGHLNIGGNCKSNTIDPALKSDLYRVMATAAYNTNQLPDEIKKTGPGGSDISGNTAGAKQIFGYAKWIMSPNAAQEILGKTLAPFAINIGTIFVLITTLTAIYFLINLIVIVLKFVAWIVNQILKLIPFW